MFFVFFNYQCCVSRRSNTDGVVSWETFISNVLPHLNLTNNLIWFFLPIYRHSHPEQHWMLRVFIILQILIKPHHLNCLPSVSFPFSFLIYLKWLSVCKQPCYNTSCSNFLIFPTINLHNSPGKREIMAFFFISSVHQRIKPHHNCLMLTGAAATSFKEKLHRLRPWTKHGDYY